VTRQVMFWFDPFLPERFPIYVWPANEPRPFYGFPATDGRDRGVKVAIHGSGDACAPHNALHKLNNDVKSSRPGSRFRQQCHEQHVGLDFCPTVPHHRYRFAR